uniref:Uncharacterized protein n=1 Tax=Avena sativa TaxID=4498 RepID=A0ACD5T6J5_AVESA
MPGAKAGSGGGARILVKVKGQDGEEVIFRVKRSSRLQKLMDTYTKDKALNGGAFVFLFDGSRINGDETPEELEIEDGDIIAAMLHQTGGGGGSLLLAAAA